MRRDAVISISVICGVLATVGCGRRQVADVRPVFAPDCIALPEPAAPPDTVRIALPGDVDPLHAPAPRNESERILFNHLYETLVNIDCGGNVRPGLASQWYGGDGGYRWTFDLRPDATFWDGSPVTPRDIVACWQSREIEPLVWAAGVDSVAAAGERSVHVYLASPRRELPRVLSAPPFAVAKTEPPHRWPLGSAPCRIESEPAWSTVMYRRPITVSPSSGTGGKVILFLEPGSYETSDSRDLLEGTVDLMITRDPDVIEYASARPHLETIPLPWHRTYVLLSTTRVRDIRFGHSPAGFDRDFMYGLARDAVPGVARANEGRSWWEKSSRCAFLADGSGWRPSLSHSAYTVEGPRRIVFDEDDPVARGLAERIVALGAAGAGSSPEAARLAEAVPGLEERPGDLSAAGVPETELSRSLREGVDFAYVIWLPLHPPDPCTGVTQLAGRARWMTGLGEDFTDALLPLVDTRRYAVVRRASMGIATDWYGNLFITGASFGATMQPLGR